MILRRRFDLCSFPKWLESQPAGELLHTSIRCYESEARRFVEFAGPPKRKGWRKEDVERWIDSRTNRRTGKPITGKTKNRALGVVKLLCVYVGVPNATKGIRRSKVKQGLPKPVIGLEFLLNGADPNLRLTCVFIASTGLRPAEATQEDGCFFEQVDTAEGPFLRVHGKGDKDRVVPLSEKAAAALSALGGRVPYTKRQLAIATAKLGFNPHRLRDTAACEWAENEVDLAVIQDLLGHASPVTTRKYTANTIARLRRGVEKRRPA